ncbi:nucleotidyltransferase family protein, partial [Candidatus Giovannonibacteria bacterium]|nr:nucleotidyltransferase family protein [Candidatus Giovannonibacteria bacterium]
MIAVIPCAGEGVRMRPLTLTKPKQLLEIAGKPILEHIFENLPDEIDEVVLVVGYMGDKIRERFQDNFGRFRIRYVEQKEKLGTADALWRCRGILGKERFLMLYGDDILDRESIAKCLRHDLAILVKEVDDPRRFGVVVADGKGRVIKLVEKPDIPPSNFASTGVKVLDERIFNYPAERHPNGEFYITDSLARLAKDHDVFVEQAQTWLS